MTNIAELEKGENYHDVIKRVMNEQVFYNLDDDQKSDVINSERATLSRQLLEEAAKHARTNGIDVEDFELNLVPNVISFLDSLKHGLVHYNERDFRKKFYYWRHENHPIYILKNKKNTLYGPL